METHGWLVEMDEWEEASIVLFTCCMLMLSDKHVYNAFILSHSEGGCDL